MRFEPIHIGNDFNVGHMAAIAMELENGILYAMKEFIDYYDTPDLILAIQSAFSGRKIFSYPDSSGKNRTTTNAGVTDITLLRQAKFTVRTKTHNPAVKDRVASVNRAFEKKKLFINTSACPILTEALEQQVYLNNGQPDKTSGQDHILDALGYPVHYIMPVRSTGIQGVAIAH